MALQSQPSLTMTFKADHTPVTDAEIRIENTIIEKIRQKFPAHQVLTEEERDDIDTLGGLVFTLVGRVPTRGELVSHSSGIEFEVLEGDPRRLKKLRIRNLPRPVAASAAE